jgi:hypothetical protein
VVVRCWRLSVVDARVRMIWGRLSVVADGRFKESRLVVIHLLKSALGPRFLVEVLVAGS